MSGVAVVDASALAALAFREPLGETARDRLKNRQLVAPRLTQYELANIALKKIRLHPEQSALVRAGLALVIGDDFTIYWSDVEPLETLDLAVQTGLTAYDASYLWLARHLDAELVTFDTSLDAAARRLP